MHFLRYFIGMEGNRGELHSYLLWVIKCVWCISHCIKLYLSNIIIASIMGSSSLHWKCTLPMILYILARLCCRACGIKMSCDNLHLMLQMYDALLIALYNAKQNFQFNYKLSAVAHKEHIALPLLRIVKPPTLFWITECCLFMINSVT